MKKLFGLLAGLAFATAFADPVDLVPTAKSFEVGEQRVDEVGPYNYSASEFYYDESAGEDVEGNYWLYGPGNGAATVKAFGDEVQYSYADATYAEGGRYGDFETAEDNDNYLSIETAANAPLFRTLADCSSATQQVAIGENGIMIDTLVKFTGAEEDPTPGAEDKLIVWLKGVESETDPEVVAGETNLYITAGLVTDEATTATNIQITGYADGTSLQVVPDTWYRLTVKAMANIFEDGSELTVPGFLVYLNGKLVRHGGAQLVDVTDNPSELAQAHIDNCTLFPSLVRGDATLTAVGFEGTGGIDDLRIADGTEAPGFAQEFTISYVYGEDDGWNYVEDFTPKAFYTPDEGTVLLPAANQFVSGTYAFAGWYTNENYLGEVVTSFDASEGGARTFWAKFEAVQSGFTFTLPVLAHASVAVSVSGNPVAADSGTTFTVPSGSTIDILYTADSGYAFYGGSTSFLPVQVADATSEAQILAALTTAGASDAEAKIYGIWYNLDSKGEMPVGAPTSYAVTNEDFELAAPIAYDGYSFLGWYTNALFEGDRVFTNYVADAEEKYYAAKWDLVNYTVTYLETNGTASAEMPAQGSYTVEDEPATFTLQAPAEKTGYSFMGWFDNQGLEGQAVTSFAVSDAANKTFYAKWQAQMSWITWQYEDIGASPVSNIAVDVVANANPGSWTYGESFLFESNKVVLAGFTCVGFRDALGNPIDGIAATDLGNITVTALLKADEEDEQYEPLKPGDEPEHVDSWQDFVDATNAVGGVVGVPDAVAAVLTTAQQEAYQALFTYVATPNVGGGYDVTVDFTEAAKAALEAEADAKAETLPLATLAAGETSESTLPDLTPGLYYSVVYGTGVTAISSEGTRAMAGPTARPR